jgi:16S rRNA U516 pseudouridylate synthase RsuA-like enzyme
VSVSRLMRVRFGNIMLPTDLRVGQHLELSKPLASELCNLVGLNGNGVDKAS